MQFEKGKSGNPSGRPKGAKGKKSMTSLEFKEKLTDLMNGSFDRLEKEFLKLDGKSLISFYRHFSEFIIAKESRQEPYYDVSNMTEAESEKLLDMMEARQQERDEK